MSSAQPMPATPPSQALPVRRHLHWLKWLLWAAAALALAAALCWSFRVPALTSLANAWVVNDPLEKSDAIFVLGGGLETRPFEAARLYREGFAPRILVSNTKTRRVNKLGLQPTETDWLRAILVKEGVPDSAITPIGESNTTTHDEALALAIWARDNHAKSIIIPTDLFHSHRVAWIFRKVLRPMGVQAHVTAIPHPEYSTLDWWQHEDGLITFQNEVLKELYYRLRY